MNLHKCHYHVHIPSNPDYSSLNLATAVQVLSYEIRMASLADAEGNLPSLQEWDQPPVPADDWKTFMCIWQRPWPILSSMIRKTPSNY